MTPGSKRLASVWVGCALAAGAFVATRGAVAGEPRDGEVSLERAERIEREGKELFERGQKADGARRLSEAWAIRAEVFAREARAAREDGGAKDAGLDPRAAAARIRAALAERERALEAARAAGREREQADHAAACEALRAKLKAAEEAAARAGAEAGRAIPQERRKAIVEELRRESQAAEARGKELVAQGWETGAAEQFERSKKLWEKADAIEKGEADGPRTGAPEAGPDRERIVAEVRRLREQLEELRKALDEMRRQLSERTGPK